MISHGQVDWTPIHIINGRRITIAHINSEYTEFADPFLSIENGVECISLSHNPGGRRYSSEWRELSIELDDGITAYSKVSNRWGMWRIGGMNNALIGGENYVASTPAITGQAWIACAARDPYLTKWNPVHGSGINFAAPLHMINWKLSENSLCKNPEDQLNGAIILSISQACTTAFMNKETGEMLTDGLKNKAIRMPPKMIRPYTPSFPDIDMSEGGPGTDMSTKSAQEIVNAVNGEQTIFLGPGTYEIPSTMRGGAIYGAGKDRTILKFPDGIRCFETPIKLFNLTIEGGKVGYAQTYGAGPGIDATNIRFRNQTDCGVTFGNAQNSHIRFIDFENCNIGIATCADAIPCGENGSGGGKRINLIFNLLSDQDKSLISCRTKICYCILLRKLPKMVVFHS